MRLSTFPKAKISTDTKTTKLQTVGKRQKNTGGKEKHQRFSLFFFYIYILFILFFFSRYLGVHSSSRHSSKDKREKRETQGVKKRRRIPHLSLILYLSVYLSLFNLSLIYLSMFLSTSYRSICLSLVYFDVYRRACVAHVCIDLGSSERFSL